jgi:hypothetical protein
LAKLLRVHLNFIISRSSPSHKKAIVPRMKNDRFSNELN